MLSMRARLAVSAALCAEVKRWRVSQERAAARLGVHRTVLNRLLNWNIKRFALGYLIDLADVGGVQVEVRISGSNPVERAKAEPDSDRAFFFGARSPARGTVVKSMASQLCEPHLID